MKPSYEVLTRLPLFASIDAVSAQQAIDMLETKHFKTGEVILRQGEWQGELYIVCFGLVSVTTNDARGDSVELYRLGRGECFGEMALITGQPPSATVTAIADTDTWVLSQQDFVALMTGCPAISHNISRVVSQRLSTTSGKYAARHLAQTLVLLDSLPGIEGSVICFNIAASLTRQTRRKVLLLELARESQCAAPCSPGLDRLASLVEDQTQLHTHEAPIDGHNSLYGLRVGRLASSPQANGMQPADVLAVLSMLEPLYDYVLIRLPLGGDGVYGDVIEQADRLFALVHYHQLTRGDHPLDFLRALPNAGQSTGILVVGCPPDITMSAAKRLGAHLQSRIEGILPGDTALLQSALNPPFVLSNASSPLSQAIDRAGRRLAKISVGVALGGGGAKGLAHLGVLKALHEEGIPIDYLSGTSFGAFVGGLYAMGYEPSELKKVVPGIMTPAALKTFLWSSLLKLSFASVLGGKGVEKGLRGAFGERQFEDLKIPFAAIAVDLKAGSEVVITDGPLYLAVRASVSIPGIFPPVQYGDQYLVDGGVLNPLPTDTVGALGADIVIGVDVSNPMPLRAWPGEDAKAEKFRQRVVSQNVVGILRRVVDVMQIDISQKGTEKAAVLIRPRFGPSGPYDFHRQEQFAAAGENAVREVLPQLRTLLPWLEA